MRQLAEAGMAFSGKTLSEVKRYTAAADKKRLADSGAAKMGEARTPARKRLTDQSANADYTASFVFAPIVSRGRTCQHPPCRLA